MCDSFDTKTAVNELASLVSATNTYLQGEILKLPILQQVSRYIFKILSAFGVYESSDLPKVEAGGEVENVEESITPVMNALSNFRDQVKRRAEEGPKVLF